jgi:hypothetical protein
LHPYVMRCSPDAKMDRVQARRFCSLCPHASHATTA